MACGGGINKEAEPRNQSRQSEPLKWNQRALVRGESANMNLVEMSNQKTLKFLFQLKLSRNAKLYEPEMFQNKLSLSDQSQTKNELFCHQGLSRLGK